MNESKRDQLNPRWFVPGDLNGFFGLVVDNLSILGFIAAALIGIFGIAGRDRVRSHVPRHRVRRAGRQPASTPDGAAPRRAHRARRRHRDAARPRCADQHRHGAAGARSRVRRLHAAGTRCAGRGDRHLAARHGVAGGDGRAQVRAVLRRRRDHATGAARGVARCDRRYGAGAAGVPASGGDAARAGGRLRGAGPAAVRAGRARVALPVARARRAAGVRRRHGSVLRTRRSPAARPTSRWPEATPLRTGAAVADPRLHRRPAGDACRTCRCCCRSAC